MTITTYGLVTRLCTAHFAATCFLRVSVYRLCLLKLLSHWRGEGIATHREWLASRPIRLTTGEITAGTHLIGDWVYPIAVVDTMQKGKLLEE
jgi:hypothetical protein